jgi:hypothetical protein
MKKLLIAFTLMLLLHCSEAQYYYLDILGIAQTSQQYSLISKNNLQRISATSYESNNQPSTDFVLEQTISSNKQQIVTRSASVNSVESYFTSYYNNGLLASTTDSSNNAINTVVYTYNNEKQLIASEATSKDFDGTLISVEIHQWKYNSNGKPEAMVKVKNGKDTTMIALKYDEQGNVAEENWRKNNRVIETYYYYYNPKNQLTDIVRYNRKAKQMLPDIMFEYDAAGRLYQMIQTQGSAANYFVWRYVYNPSGMKEKEYVFNKKKELLGKIEYNYK